jgi:hypothetical protein
MVSRTECSSGYKKPTTLKFGYFKFNLNYINMGESRDATGTPQLDWLKNALTLWRNCFSPPPGHCNGSCFAHSISEWSTGVPVKC